MALPNYLNNLTNKLNVEIDSLQYKNEFLNWKSILRKNSKATKYNHFNKKELISTDFKKGTIPYYFKKIQNKYHTKNINNSDGIITKTNALNTVSSNNKFFLKNKNKSNNLIILHQNIAGAISKSEEIILSISDLIYEIDVICLCETLIKKGTEQLLKLPGYKLISFYSRNEKRGGTCILVKKHIECKKLDLLRDFSCNYDFECSGIDIKYLNMIIICIYRNKNISVFIQNLERLLLKIGNKKKKIILCGDWNIDLLKKK